MRIVTELFRVNGEVLCSPCMANRNLDSARIERVRSGDTLVCESCGAKLRMICAHCGNFHIDPTRDIEEQVRWCAEQERISIEAERLEFFDKWL